MLDAPLPNDPKRDCETVNCANCEAEVPDTDAYLFGTANLCHGCWPVATKGTLYLQDYINDMERKVLRMSNDHAATVQGLRTELRQVNFALRTADARIRNMSKPETVPVPSHVDLNLRRIW